MRILTKFAEQTDKLYTKIDCICNNAVLSAMSNPTVTPYNDTVLINFREINYISYIPYTDKYKQDISGWISADVCESKNTLYFIESNKLSVYSKTLDIPAIISNNKYNGLEDAIFVRWNDCLYLCGTRPDVQGDNTFKTCICIYKIDDDWSVEKPIIIKDSSLNSVEKHWSPIEDIPFTFIRWCNPTEIVKINPKTGKIVNHTKLTYSNIAGNDKRGNCHTIKYKDGYLSIVHNVRYIINKNSQFIPEYRHYFVKYDKNFNIEKFSKPFCFEYPEIEFCCGLCRIENDFYISYSVFDAKSSIIRISENTIETILNNSSDLEFCSYTKPHITEIMQSGDVLFNNMQYHAAMAYYSRVFTQSNEFEYDSLLKFCTCMLCLLLNGVEVFPNKVVKNFIDRLLLFDDETADKYLILSTYYATQNDCVKAQYFLNKSNKNILRFPKIKRYLSVVNI